MNVMSLFAHNVVIRNTNFNAERPIFHFLIDPATSSTALKTLLTLLSTQLQ